MKGLLQRFGGYDVDNELRGYTSTEEIRRVRSVGRLIAGTSLVMTAALSYGAATSDISIGEPEVLQDASNLILDLATEILPPLATAALTTEGIYIARQASRREDELANHIEV